MITATFSVPPTATDGWPTPRLDVADVIDPSEEAQ